MATRNVTLTPFENGRGSIAIWTGLLNGDDGTPIDWTRFADRCIQFTGTFGTGGSIQMEGSNDGTNWGILNDLQGSQIVKTATGIEGIAEVPRYVRPKVTAGDGTTSLTATLVLRCTP